MPWMLAMQMVSPEGCTGQGLISIVMTAPAQHKGQDVSKLQASQTLHTLAAEQAVALPLLTARGVHRGALSGCRLVTWCHLRSSLFLMQLRYLPAKIGSV